MQSLDAVMLTMAALNSIMAGPVQETSPQQQQQATKRYAEADLEPSPVAKRPAAEDLEHKHQLQLVDASTNAPQPIEKNATQDTALLFTENGKPSVKHQPEVINEEAAETNHSEVKNGGLEAAGHGSDPGAIATQLVIEAAAAHEEAHKLVKIAAQKQAEAVEFVEALKAATKDVSADQPTAKPVVPASEMVPAASQESTKPVGAELFSGPQTKEKAPQAPVPPTDQKISEATPPQKEAESAQSDASVDVSSQQPDPVMATPVPTMETCTPVADKVFPPPVEKLTPANPLAQTASTPLIGNIPPPVEKLTPANPLPQTASTPLIGNIPPQAVEGLKAASQQAASILPLEPTQELLEQQATIRTTPLSQPLDQGVVAMEE